MKFYQLALLGTVTAIKITEESPDSVVMLKLDEERKRRGKNGRKIWTDPFDVAAPSCPGHPGMEAAMGWWYDRLKEGKNATWVEPTVEHWLPRICANRRTSDSIECPTESDASAVWDIAYGYGKIVKREKYDIEVESIPNE